MMPGNFTVSLSPVREIFRLELGGVFLTVLTGEAVNGNVSTGAVRLGWKTRWWFLIYCYATPSSLVLRTALYWWTPLMPKPSSISILPGNA